MIGIWVWKLYNYNSSSIDKYNVFIYIFNCYDLYMIPNTDIILFIINYISQEMWKYIK